MSEFGGDVIRGKVYILRSGVCEGKSNDLKCGAFPPQTVERCDPHIGLLHRGTEKLMEYKTYLQV